MIYLDSSAFVKRYVQEKGSNKVTSILVDTPMVSTSKLTYPEIVSGLCRKRREKGIDEKDFHSGLNRFESDWGLLIIVEFQDELLPIIKRLSLKHALKGADTIHLASAIWLKDSVNEELSFVTSDIKLFKAAKKEGINTINPETEAAGKGA